jgi:hypothetical protein
MIIIFGELLLSRLVNCDVFIVCPMQECILRLETVSRPISQRLGLGEIREGLGLVSTTERLGLSLDSGNFSNVSVSSRSRLGMSRAHPCRYVA